MTRLTSLSRLLAFGVFSAATVVLTGANPAQTSKDISPAQSASEREAFFRAQSSKPGEFRATWCHSAYGIEGWGWDRTVAVLKTNGFNAIIPNLLWAGLAHYPSKILPVSSKVQEHGDQVAECLKACRKYGIEIHVWKVNQNLSTAPKEFRAKLRAEGRTQKSKSGEDMDWLCPSHPDNFALERDSMLEVVRNYDVDGVHFDYIRYPNSGVCYCAGCQERFEKAAGVKMEKFPEDVITSQQAGKFNDWRREQITRLVRAVSTEARKLKPRIKISAAVFRDWESCRQSIGQDWKAWVEAGYLDFVCPMDYDGDNSKFAESVRKQVTWVNHQIPLYPGIGSHKLSGPEQLVRQIQLTRELGADGFVVFNLTEKLATEFLPPLRLRVTSASPKRPAGSQ